MEKTIEEVLTSVRNFLRFIRMILFKRYLKSEISATYLTQQKFELYTKLVYSSIGLICISAVNEYLNTDSIFNYYSDVKDVNIPEYVFSLSFQGLIPAIVIFIILLEVFFKAALKPETDKDFILAYIFIFVSYFNVLFTLIGIVMCIIALLFQHLSVFAFTNSVANFLFFIFLIACFWLVNKRYRVIKKLLDVDLSLFNILSFLSLILFLFLLNIFSYNKKPESEENSVSFITNNNYRIFFADSLGPNNYYVYSEFILEYNSKQKLVFKPDTINFNLYVLTHNSSFFSRLRKDVFKFRMTNEDKIYSIHKDESVLFKIEATLDSSQIRKILPAPNNFPDRLTLKMETLSHGEMELFKANIQPRFVFGSNFKDDGF